MGTGHWGGVWRGVGGGGDGWWCKGHLVSGVDSGRATVPCGSVGDVCDGYDSRGDQHSPFER